MRKLMLSVAAIALMSSPAYAFHGWMMVAYETITSNRQEIVNALVKRSFFNSEAQYLMGKEAMEQAR